MLRLCARDPAGLNGVAANSPSLCLVLPMCCSFVQLRVSFRAGCSMADVVSTLAGPDVCQCAEHVQTEKPSSVEWACVTARVTALFCSVELGSWLCRLDKTVTGSDSSFLA